MQRLFVYGTLAPGRPNEHKLSDIDGTWVDATVKGKLIEAGWGAQMGYPAISLDKDGDDVKGFVFSSKELFKKWEMLDTFEGEEYERVLVAATLESGETVEVYVYALK